MAEYPAPRLLGTDHLELWVGNAKQAAYFYTHGFGFDLVAYAGPETGLREEASYVVRQGSICLVLTGSMGPQGPIATHVARHGDGVKVIALAVDDAVAAYEQATGRGAVGVEEPTKHEDPHGVVLSSAVATYGDTVHRFIDRSAYHGPFLPGFTERHQRGGGVGVTSIDHVVGNVEEERMETWAAYYRTVFDFDVFIEFDEHDIATQYSALRSKVARDPRSFITYPLNEPFEGRRRSQIQEYLDFYGGPGVQHIAMSTTDIFATVAELKDRGIEFLATPHSYYEELGDRADGLEVDLGRLEELSILLDRDDAGHLLQIFTKPVTDRPTMFFEIIERRGSAGFGKGNFKALFEAIEREQERRGNL